MIDNLLRELGYVRTEHVNRALKQVRNAVGDEGFRQLQERFRPRYSVWAQYAMRWGFERFIAYPDNPVLVPGLEPWALASPTAWRDDKSVMLLYEVIGSSSTADGYVARREVRLAASIDGYHFDETAIRSVTLADDSFGDAVNGPIRLSAVGNAFFLTYSASWQDTIAVARSNDLQHWQPFRLTVPGWGSVATRQGGLSQGAQAVILPQPVDNRWWMYLSGDTDLWAAWTNDQRLERWELIKHPVLSPREGYFDELLVNLGPRPIYTAEGIIVVYNALSQSLGWSAGQALFSGSDPTRCPFTGARRDTPMRGGG